MLLGEKYPKKTHQPPDFLCFYPEHMSSPALLEALRENQAMSCKETALRQVTLPSLWCLGKETQGLGGQRSSPGTEMGWAPRRGSGAAA